MRLTSARAGRILLQLAPVIVVATLVGIAAADSGGSGDKRTRKRDGLAGAVRIDGAGAMRGLVDRAAQRFERRHPDVRVTVGASGDESAIALFCAGEVDLAAVARRLDRAERRACRSSGTEYDTIKVAREGIALVVSDGNGFVDCLGLDQVKAIWRRLSPAKTWTAVDPRFPAAQLEPTGLNPDNPPATLLAEALFGPVDPLMRDDYRVADDSREVSKVVAASPTAIGFLPLTELRPGSSIRPLAVDAGYACVTPTVQSVRDGSYRVLSRPLELDVRADALRHREVRRFVGEYLAHPPAITKADGAVPVVSSHRVYRKFTRP
jgi:phosphate transport system substrate-binding protein